MACEIAEQPVTVAGTLDRLLPVRGEISRLTRHRRHPLFIGRGTSDNAAVYGRYLCQIHSGRRAALAAPSWPRITARTSTSDGNGAQRR
ncbi:hypothetical protein ACQP1W_02810 [Spirillospora sp. CA-255316]